MAKHDQKGRSKTDARHTRLPHLMTGSAAWLDLPGNAVKTLVALQRFDRGQDNGRLFLGAQEAAIATGLSPNTVMNALRELEEHGFIAAVERGHFQVKGGVATCWRLTFVSVPTSSSGATSEWQRWAPPPPSGNKTRAQNLTATGANSDIGRGNTEAAGSKIAPIPMKTSHVSVSTASSNIAPQVVCHRQGSDQGVLPQRKSPFLRAALPLILSESNCLTRFVSGSAAIWKRPAWVLRPGSSPAPRCPAARCPSSSRGRTCIIRTSSHFSSLLLTRLGSQREQYGPTFIIHRGKTVECHSREMDGWLLLEPGDRRALTSRHSLFTGGLREGEAADRNDYGGSLIAGAV